MIPLFTWKFPSRLGRNVRRFALFFSAQFVLYGLLTWNYRAIANIWPVSVVSSDLAIALINFKLIKKITESADHGPALYGYVLGGAVGSLCSMYLSLWLFGR